jgi:hypothetical protein
VALHGGSTTAAWRRSGGGGWRKEKGSFTGRAPFIAGRGGGRRATQRRNRGGETVTGSRGRDSRWWPRLGVVSVVRTRSVCGSDRAADGWAQWF